MRRQPRNPKRKTPPLVVRAAPRDRRLAILQLGPLRLRAALGRSGITAFKREGDGGTPRAAMRLLEGFYRNDRPGTFRSALQFSAIRSDMLWCDTPAHPAYNRRIRGPSSASHERLMRPDNLYDVCIVLDWNITSRRRNRGSAIFLHLARENYLPTEGCVALCATDMRRILPHLGRHSVLRIL